MGGAIQALWCMERTAGLKTDIADLVDAHVALEGGTTTQPDEASMAAYDAAYQTYSKYLAALSPLYR